MDALCKFITAPGKTIQCVFMKRGSENYCMGDRVYAWVGPAEGPGSNGKAEATKCSQNLVSFTVLAVGLEAVSYEILGQL